MKLKIFAWIAFALLLFTIPIYFWIQNPIRQKIPVLGKVPAFQLTTAQNQPFTEKDLRGNIWIANFIFTSCGSACPLLTEKMHEVQEYLKKNKLNQVKLLSLSVDPEHDTPAILARYAKAHDADPELWTFLTGEFKDMEQAVVKGFKMSMGKMENESALDIMHGERFVLMDRESQIRGYFAVNEDGLLPLLSTLPTLLAERTK